MTKLLRESNKVRCLLKLKGHIFYLDTEFGKNNANFIPLFHTVLFFSALTLLLHLTLQKPSKAILWSMPLHFIDNNFYPTCDRTSKEGHLDPHTAGKAVRNRFDPLVNNKPITYCFCVWSFITLIIHEWWTVVSFHVLGALIVARCLVHIILINIILWGRN